MNKESIIMNLTMDQLKANWKKHYEHEPNAEMDAVIKIGIQENHGSYTAYFGTEDGYEEKRTVSNVKDIVDGINYFLSNTF